MYPQKIISLTIEYYQKLTKLSADTMLQTMCRKSGVPIESISKTEFPVCPWCGGEYKNHKELMLKDHERLCCREDTDKQFIIIRHEETKTLFTTHKVTEK